MKQFIKEIKPNVKLFKDSKTGLIWIENGMTGTKHSPHLSIDVSGSIKGMKEKGYWDKKDIIVRSYGFYYNISKVSIHDELDQIAFDYCECSECQKKKKNK